MNLKILIGVNSARWQSVQVDANRLPEIDWVANRLVAAEAKSRYVNVQSKTGVPWWTIAVIHERESSQSWRANLAQGDPWNRVSIHVPRGRGPFGSWDEAAIDALVHCAPQAARWLDWSAGGTLTLLETYNGLGYFDRGLPSPYVWAATNKYLKGKFVTDGHFDPDVIDRQIGCAALLIRMMAKDSTIKMEIPT